MLKIQKNNTNTIILPIVFDKNPNYLYILLEGEFDNSSSFFKTHDNYISNNRYYSFTIVEGINGIKLNTGEYKFKLYSSPKDNIVSSIDTSLKFLSEEILNVQGVNYNDDIVTQPAPSDNIVVHYPNTHSLITVEPTSLLINSNSQIRTIKVSSEGLWTLINLTSWITSDITTGTKGDSIVQLTIESNTSLEDRIDKLIFKIDDINYFDFNIKQLGTGSSQFDEYATEQYVIDAVSVKQDKLIPGENITIVNNVINAKAGGSSLFGTGFVKVRGAEVYYDNSNYVTYDGTVANARNSSFLNGLDSSYYLDYTHLTNKPIPVDISNKKDKENIIVDLTATSVSTWLVTNTYYRYNIIKTLDLSFPLVQPNETYETTISFTSGDYMTITYNLLNILWQGVDVLSGDFLPENNKRYTIVFWFDGLNMNAVVGGV